MRGYHGTSIGDLADAMQLTPGSLYKAFKDKQGILLAAFDRYRVLRSTKLKAAIAPHALGGDKIRAALHLYAEAACGDPGQRGCLVIATAAELAATDPVAAERVAVAHAANEAVTKDCILLGQADGSISADIDAADTALCAAVPSAGHAHRRENRPHPHRDDGRRRCGNEATRLTVKFKDLDLETIVTSIASRGDIVSEPQSLETAGIEPKAMSSGMTFLLAAACGLIAANLYYAQPLVGPISTSLGLSPGQQD